MKIVVTGAGGLLGWHASARIHAINCAAMHKGKPKPHELVALNRNNFNDDEKLYAGLIGADAVLHFAGINRGRNEDIEAGNPEIARRLSQYCMKANVRPHVVHSNSTQSVDDTPYGRSKRIASEILSCIGGAYTDLILPNLFGEGARPRYNNVTATFIEALIKGAPAQINKNGKIPMLHVGAAAEIAINAVADRLIGSKKIDARLISVADLFAKLQEIHRDYSANIFPNLQDSFTLDIFNSYRSALYPQAFPRRLTLNSDPRGTLFEVAKGGGGGQFFSSWTQPGAIRGNHFHLRKVERFLVVSGDAIIRMRRVLNGSIWEYRVNGDAPAVVDIPTLHTHSIENVGRKPLLSLFWTHNIFNPAAADTFQDLVQEDGP